MLYTPGYIVYLPILHTEIISLLFVSFSLSSGTSSCLSVASSLMSTAFYSRFTSYSSISEPFSCMFTSSSLVSDAFSLLSDRFS